MNKAILIVDDDEDIRQMLQDRLELYGYTVETAATGREALDRLQRRQYQGVLLDLRMPVMTGFEALAEMRRLYPLLPVVLMTASENRTELQSLRENREEVLLKPIDPERLTQVVKQWFGPPF